MGKDLVVAGTRVKCAGMPHEGAFLMRITIPIWFDSIKCPPIDLEMTHEPCNVAFVQAYYCNHAIVRCASKFIKEILFQNVL